MFDRTGLVAVLDQGRHCESESTRMIWMGLKPLCEPEFRIPKFTGAERSMTRQ